MGTLVVILAYSDRTSRSICLLLQEVYIVYFGIRSSVETLIYKVRKNNWNNVHKKYQLTCIFWSCHWKRSANYIRAPQKKLYECTCYEWWGPATVKDYCSVLVSSERTHYQILREHSRNNCMISFKTPMMLKMWLHHLYQYCNVIRLGNQW